MRIDLAGRRALVVGAPHAVLDAVAEALRANGAAVARAPGLAEASAPDILVLCRALQPQDLSRVDPDDAAALDRLGETMRQRRSGRIVMIVSALAIVAARRHPEASIAAAAALAQVRTLAMRLGPAVLVNAVACGAVTETGGALVAGDLAMLSHVPSGRPGAIGDVAHAVLFACDPMNSYMTGQVLAVDGGWSAGYGRNF